MTESPASKLIIYRSPYGGLNEQPTAANVFDFMRARVLPETLESKQPFQIDVETKVSRSMAQLLERVGFLSRYLNGTLGSSDHNLAHDTSVDEPVISVGILSPNHLDYPVIIYGCLAAGIPVAPMFSDSSPAEFEYLAGLARCKLVFVERSQLKIVQKSQYPISQVILLDQIDSWRGITMEKALREGSRMPEVASARDGHHPIPLHQVALILFSSGSTGKPKAVMLSHRNIWAALRSAEISAFISMEALSKANQPLVYKPGDTIIGLTILPMYHAYGMMSYILGALRPGVCLCIIKKWNLDQGLRAIEKYKITTFTIVPTIATQIIASPDKIKDVDLSSIKSLIVGSSAISALQKTRLVEILASRGAFGQKSEESNAINGYGMSETTVSITTWPVEGSLAGRAKPGSLGILLPALEARVISEGREEDVEIHTPGELVLRGGTIMKGYLGNRKATEEAFIPGGWFRTGDKVRIDPNGQLFYIDRLKDTFKNRGLQVSPSEIQEVIMKAFEGLIDELIIIGVSESKEGGGNRAWGFVKIRDDGSKKTISEQILSFSELNLPKHKRLARIVFIDNFPKGPSHKILTRELRVMAERIIQDEQNLKRISKL